jgi:predicted transcriptional regulator
LSLQSFEEKQASFNRVRALIMKIVKVQPGLTVEEVSKQFLLAYGFLPQIGNRLREARKLGWVESREEDGRLRWYVKNE